MGLRLVIILPLLPIFALVLVLMWADGSATVQSVIVVVAIHVATIAMVLSMHAFISLGKRSVRIGFVPFFWRTIPYRQIAHVEMVHVDPMRDYHGWGIKGSSSSKGILFSGGRHHGIMITTQNDRRYIITLHEAVDGFVETLRARVG